MYSSYFSLLAYIITFKNKVAKNYLIIIILKGLQLKGVIKKSSFKNKKLYPYITKVELYYKVSCISLHISISNIIS